MHGDTYYDLRQTRHVEIPDAVKRIYTIVENHLRLAPMGMAGGAYLP